MGDKVAVCGEELEADFAFKYFDRQTSGLLQDGLISFQSLFLDAQVALHLGDRLLALLRFVFQLDTAVVSLFILSLGALQDLLGVVLRKQEVLEGELAHLEKLDQVLVSKPFQVFPLELRVRDVLEHGFEVGDVSGLNDLVDIGLRDHVPVECLCFFGEHERHNLNLFV